MIKYEFFNDIQDEILARENAEKLFQKYNDLLPKMKSRIKTTKIIIIGTIYSNKEFKCE